MAKQVTFIKDHITGVKEGAVHIISDEHAKNLEESGHVKVKDITDPEKGKGK